MLNQNKKVGRPKQDCQEKQVPVFVRLPDGRQRACNFAPQATIMEVLTGLSQPVCSVRHQGRTLPAKMTLAQAQIRPNECLELGVTLLGGAEPKEALNTRAVVPNIGSWSMMGVLSSQVNTDPNLRSQMGGEEAKNQPDQDSTEHSESEEQENEPPQSDDEPVTRCMISECLSQRLSRCQFYNSLSEAQKEDVVQELLKDEAEIEKIDVEKGYRVMEDDDSFIEALNSMYSNKRQQLYQHMQKGEESRKFFSKYLLDALHIQPKKGALTQEQLESYVKTQTEFQKVVSETGARIQKMAVEKVENIKSIDAASKAEDITRQDGMISEREQQGADDKEHLRRWYRQHYFDKKSKSDMELVAKLREDSLKDNIPPLPYGKRFLPVVKALGSLERKLDILKVIREDQRASSAYMSIVCESYKDKAEMLAHCETLAELVQVMPPSELQRLMPTDEVMPWTEIITRIQNPTQLIKQTLQKLAHVESNEPKSVNETQKEDDHIKKLWNSLEPKRRQELASLLSSKRGVSALSNRLYSALSLDSRVELLGLLDEIQGVEEEKADKKQVLEEQNTQQVQTDQIDLLDDSEKTERLLHRFFYLQETHSKARTNALLGDHNKDRDFPLFTKALQKVEKDLHKQWQYVPLDVPGNYLQCMPLPGQSESFLLVQPFCFNKLEGQETQNGKVHNSAEPSTRRLKREQACPIELESKAHEKINGDMFSVISLWKYEQKAYVCKHSFTTPKILSVAHASEESFTESHVIRGQNNSLYFFCEGSTDWLDENDYRSRDKGSKQLYMCQIKSLEATQRDRVFSSNFSDNVEFHRISSDSQLYKCIKQESYPEVSQFKKMKKRFHETPPTFFDAGRAGTFCAFSLFKRDEFVPSIYIYSFNQGREIVQVKGAEGFIGYVSTMQKTVGNIYVLVQSALCSSKGNYQKITDEVEYKRQLKLHARELKNSTNMMQVHKIPIDLANPPKPAQEKSNRPGQINKMVKKTQAMYNTSGVKKCWLRVNQGTTRYQIPSCDSGNLDNILNQTQCWLTQLVPLQQDDQDGQLKSFMVQTMDHITKDYKLHVLELVHDNDDLLQGRRILRQIDIRQSFEQVGMKANYITPYLNQMPRVTTVTATEDHYLFEFYEFAEEQQEPYKKFNQQRMVRVDQAFPQEVQLSKDKKELVGCFLNEFSYSVDWFHETLIKGKVGYNFQKEFVDPQFQVEYPALCYAGVSAYMGELNIVNLADRSAPISALELENLQILSFVEFEGHYDQVKICFLAQDYSNITPENKQGRVVHCILDMDKMFQKKLTHDLSYFAFKKQQLGNGAGRADFQKLLAAAIKIESVHDLDKEKGSLFFIMQSQSTIATYQYDGKEMNEFKTISKKGDMRALTFQRGIDQAGGDQCYFYVERYQNRSDVIRELRVNRSGNFETKVATAFMLHSRYVIALEFDPDQRVADSGSNKAVNSLFFIEDNLTLKKIVQNEDGVYEVKSRWNLNQAFPSDMIGKVRELRKNDFSRISVTDKTLTINEQTINLSSKNAWEFKYGQSKNATVFSTQSIENTHRQILNFKVKDEDDRELEGLVVKPHSGGRKIDLLGMKNLHRVKTVEFITNDLILVKFMSFWTILDTTGQVQVLPRLLDDALHKSDFQQVSTKRLHSTNEVLLMLGDESLLTTVLFNHRGQVCDVNEFENYKQTEQGLTSPRQVSMHILCDDKGQVYQLCEMSQQGQQNTDVSIKEQTSSCGSGQKLINIEFPNEDVHPGNMFVICGDFLCRICPKKSCIIEYEQLSKLREAGQGLVQLTLKKIDLSRQLQESSTQALAISAAPISHLLSMRTQKKIDFSVEDQINRNLLQLTVGDRAFVIDLLSGHCIHDFADMSQLLEPLHFIPAQANIQKCTVEDGMHTLSEIVVNHSKDFFFMRDKQTKIESKQISSFGPMIQSLDDQLDGGEKTSDGEIQLTGAYKTYTESDYKELIYFYECLKNRKPVQDLDLQAVLSVYCGLTLFAMQVHPTLYQGIYKQIEVMDLSPEYDEQELEIECHAMRRMYQILSMPLPFLTFKEEQTDDDIDGLSQYQQFKMMSGMFSILELVPYISDMGSCNTLLQIASKSNQTSLQSICKMQRDFERFIENTSETVINMLNHSEIETKSTVVIKSAKWPIGEKSVAFAYPTCLITEQEVIQELVTTYVQQKSIWSAFGYIGKLFLIDRNSFDDCFQTDIVKVRQVDIGWLLANEKSFLDMSMVLTRAGRGDLYMTDFVKTILDVYWIENKWKIFWRIFIPYVFYLGMTMFYLTSYACVSDKDELEGKRTTAIICLISLLYQLRVELYQLSASRDPYKLRKHFSDVQNLADFVQYLLMTILLFFSIFDIKWPSLDSRRLTAAFLCFILWLKMFDWLRMFDTTSFYIKLIIMTIKDILPFFLIYPIFLVCFGSALYCVNMTRDGVVGAGAAEPDFDPDAVSPPEEAEGGDGGSLIEPKIGFWLIDCVINMHLLALGEFEMDNFEGEHQVLIWCIFMAAIFVNFIIALNMIIAIMSNTFNEVLAGQVQHAREMKLSLLSDYISLIRPFRHKTSHAFIITVTNQDESAEVDPMEAQIDRVRDFVEGTVKNLQDNMISRSDYTSELVADQKRTIDTFEKNLMGYLRGNFARLDKRIDEVSEAK